MVSRMLVAGRHLAVWTLFLCLISLLAFPPAATARNPYTMRDGHEGDPGDGVLNPDPVVDPDPAPKGQSFPIFSVTIILTADNHFIPVFHVIGFTDHLVQPLAKIGYLAMKEGRWHHAP